MLKQTNKTVDNSKYYHTVIHPDRVLHHRRNGIGILDGSFFFAVDFQNRCSVITHRFLIPLN